MSDNIKIKDIDAIKGPEIKRFYPKDIGQKMIVTCPVCKHTFEWDGYFTDPPFNQKFLHWFWCSECDHEWTEKFEIKTELVVN